MTRNGAGALKFSEVAHSGEYVLVDPPFACAHLNDERFVTPADIHTSQCIRNEPRKAFTVIVAQAEFVQDSIWIERVQLSTFEHGGFSVAEDIAIGIKLARAGLE